MSGKIIFKDPANPANGNAIILSAGRLDIYNCIDGLRTPTPTTTLTKCKAGSAAVGGWTELPGYWQEQPQVLITEKNIPTYYAAYRDSKQRFALGLQVASTGTAYKYKIYPSLVFYVESTGTKWSYPGELRGWSNTLSDDYDTPVIPSLITDAYYGRGAITVNYRYQTRILVGAQDGKHRHQYDYGMTIYADILRTSGNSLYVQSIALKNESGGYGQGITTAAGSFDVGDSMCAWRLRKETWPGGYSEISNGSNDVQNWLGVDSYAYAGITKTLYPAGEVFWLAVGR